MSHPGRPRKRSTEQDILRAVAELVAERGYARVTIDEVVKRAGTNKPAFYRRFRSLADVVPQLLASRHGTDEDIDTGTIVGDLVEVQRRQRLLFTDPTVIRGFAGWLADLDADPERGASFLAEYLGPRRAYTQVILARAAARGEIAEKADPGWIADLLTGPLIMHVVMPGLTPVDGALAERSVHAALDALGYRGDRSTVDLDDAAPGGNTFLLVPNYCEGAT
ncbi:TetR/AcrR family transcriptional regulator [Glycomyces buryatensis]|uniref:TetR/AcrR family transcriptional regulator n=1 Tax=Glycomyces buryatensis TaxID=2570927 RepID=A0A4S8PXB2_9ACTN|nr:TetR/AcrR family transcriptional regulator [Glycomyces buryatensis]THV34705.1 TetR/AcrR family transcriptional regulator [Glycomyces buryatensis]